MHELIASPFLDDFLVLRPGSTQGVKIPHRYYTQLSQAATGEERPGWLVDAVRRPLGCRPHRETAGRDGADADTVVV